MEQDSGTVPAAHARRFRFLSCLGRGGFGEVYRATMTDRGGVRTDVAVKVLHDEVSPDSQAVRRLRDEAHVLAALRHPAILKVHDLVVLQGRVALVTEFVDGEDLTGPLRGSPTMPVRPLVDVIGQVASALGAAWEATGEGGGKLGLVHRDVKPHNVRLGRHGEVKLLDFGIARGEGIERSARTTTGSVIGSWQYMAPEAFDGRQGPEADVFSLGCMLFEGLQGSRPWQGFEPRALYLLYLQPETLSQRLADRIAGLPEDVPAPVRELVRDLLAVRPEDRPTAAQVARRCEDLLEQIPGPPLRRWCRDRTWPEVGTRAGEFDGREVIEGDDGGRALPAARVPVEGVVPTSETLEASGIRTGARATGAIAMAASGVAGITLGAGLLLVVLALVGVVVGLGLTGPSARSVPTPEIAPPDLAAAGPAVVEDAPDPPPEAAVPADEPAPIEPPTAAVAVDERTRVPVRLVGPDAWFALPADVPPGIWVVEANFGAGFVRVATVELEAGASRSVRCNALMRSCTVR